MAEPPPKSYYTLIETSRGPDPAIVVVNSSLRTFAGRNRFLWHLRIEISCRLIGQNVMPAAEESETLYVIEKKMETRLARNNNAIFVSRVTCRGSRELSFRVHNPQLANDSLQELLDAPTQSRDWNYRMERDPEWVLSAPELTLLEKGMNVN